MASLEPHCFPALVFHSIVNKHIKIIHIITRMDMGGSAQNTLLTALHHDSQHYNVLLIKGSTLESAMTKSETKLVEDQLENAKQKGIEIINVPSLVRRISPIKDVRGLVALFRHIRKIGPHIVHTHTSKAGILGRLAAWMARVPIVIHTPHGHVFYGHFGTSLSRMFLQMEKLLSKITHHQIALTPEEGNDYLDLGVAKSNNLSVIHSGVDLNCFKGSAAESNPRRNELAIPPDSLVVGYVGWLIHIKGVTYLVKAMAEVVQRHPNSLLVLVGKGDEKGEEEVKLNKQVENLGIADNVRFLGWRPDVDEIMGCFDIFVLPSLNEGMGRVLVEAMATGLPIVASRVGGIPDLVKHGENGLLIPPADEGALERAISDLLNDKARRKRMGETGKKMCRPYSVEAMVDKIDNLYSRLLARIFHESASRDREDGRATRQPQGVGSEAYLNGTSQEPTPEDARKDVHIRGRSR
jgi:glycosyltransferase involved in cell wall biosynthesis